MQSTERSIRPRFSLFVIIELEFSVYNWFVRGVIFRYFAYRCKIFMTQMPFPEDFARVFAITRYGSRAKPAPFVIVTAQHNPDTVCVTVRAKIVESFHNIKHPI